MTFEWVPTWLPGPVVGAAVALLGWWRARAVAEERFIQQLRALSEISAVRDKALDDKMAAIKESFDQNQSNLSHLSDSFEGHLTVLRDDLRSAAQELRVTAVATGKLAAEQNVVNVVTTKALDSLAHKLEAQAAQLSEHAATLLILTQVVSRRKCDPTKPCWEA